MWFKINLTDTFIYHSILSFYWQEKDAGEKTDRKKQKRASRDVLRSVGCPQKRGGYRKENLLGFIIGYADDKHMLFMEIWFIRSYPDLSIPVSKVVS